MYLAQEDAQAHGGAGSLAGSPAQVPATQPTSRACLSGGS